MEEVSERLFPEDGDLDLDSVASQAEEIKEDEDSKLFRAVTNINLENF